MHVLFIQFMDLKFMDMQKQLKTVIYAIMSQNCRTNENNSKHWILIRLF